MKTYQLMVLAPVLLLSACVRKDKGFDGTPAPVKVEVIQVGAETGSSSSRYSGTVEEENGTILSFATAGTVEGVFFKEGQRVSKGQLLATLNSTQARNLYDAAKASLAQATDACRRMKELHDKGSLPDIKWVDAQTALDQARSAERVAAKSLADCRLYAPFSGVIADKSVERGQNVAPGSPVGRLVTVGELKVKVSVPETEIDGIALGQQATVSIAALGGRSYTGKVSEKGILADPMSRSYDVKIRISNSDGKLMPGMVADVALTSGSPRATACVVPADVVMLDENNREFVWLAQGGKAAKRFVTCGDYTPYGVTVASGLTAGDCIISAGQQKVSQGTRIKVSVKK